MRTVAIFNIWGDCLCLLPYAIENIRPVVDGIIVVWSEKSNRGKTMAYELPKDCALIQCEPQSPDPHTNEVAKRNAGLQAAREMGFSHFIMMDSDEFYDQKQFVEQKELIYSKGYLGSVCRIKTYFKSPTLTIGNDHTLVPFIHRLGVRLEYKLKFPHYPYTYDKEGHCHIDPTRRLNLSAGVMLLDITMHHYSWIRKDMSLKMENSSANLRGKRADVLYDDLRNAKDGYFCKSYQRTLMKCENQFNLPEYE